jgi:hypothetical protein
VAAATAPDPVYERLAYEAAQRALDKQERLIDELRSRTGLLLAAASLAASFLGREAFSGDPKAGLAIIALVAFLVAVAASVYVLLPKGEKFVFALVGAGLYEGLYEIKDDLAEVTCSRIMAASTEQISPQGATSPKPPPPPPPTPGLGRPETRGGGSNHGK